MIFGIGTDVLHISRIATALQQHPQRFPEKVLSDGELIEYKKITKKNAQINFVAKRWAAKEAFGKACGTGLRAPVLFPHISIEKGSLGKPIVTTNAELSQWLEERGIGTCHVSLSDEKDTLVAFVVLEKLC